MVSQRSHRPELQGEVDEETYRYSLLSRIDVSPHTTQGLRIRLYNVVKGDEVTPIRVVKMEKRNDTYIFSYNEQGLGLHDFLNLITRYAKDPEYEDFIFDDAVVLGQHIREMSRKS